MVEKGYQKKQSDGMWWLGIKLIRQESDFVDENGNPKTMPDDLSLEPPSPPPHEAERPPPPADDDFVPGFDEPPF
jgi:hypothetical protein